MVAAAFATDLTDIIVAFPNTTNWAATGGGASGLNGPETDYFVISNCLSKNAFANDLKGMGYGGAAGQTIPAGTAIFMWATHLTPNSLDSNAGGGLRLTAGDDSTNRYEWTVLGSDDFDVDVLNWPLHVVDPNETADFTVGTPTGAWDWFGVTADMVGGPTKGAPLGVGGIRHGRILTITGGDLANGYATILAASEHDMNAARRWGHLVQRGPASFRLRGLLQVGDGTTAADLRDDQAGSLTIPASVVHVANTFCGVLAVNASTRIDMPGWTFESLSNAAPGSWDTSAAASADFAGCRWKSWGVGLGLTFAAGHDCSGALFDDCGVVTQDGADLTGATFDLAANAQAVDADDLSLLAGATFVGNSNHGIRDVGSPGDKTLVVTQSGYNATTGDNLVANSGPTDAFYFNDTGGLVNLTVPNGAVSVRNGAGATTTVTVPQVTVTFTGLPVGAEFRIYDDDGDANPITIGTNREGVESLTGTTYAMSHTAAEAGDVIYAQVIDPLNFEETVVSVTLAATDQTIAVALNPEENI